jgi:hypothetical protein
MGRETTIGGSRGLPESLLKIGYMDPGSLSDDWDIKGDTWSKSRLGDRYVCVPGQTRAWRMVELMNCLPDFLKGTTSGDVRYYVAIEVVVFAMPTHSVST